jgi:hypothetical protein
MNYFSTKRQVKKFEDWINEYNNDVQILLTIIKNYISKNELKYIVDTDCVYNRLTYLLYRCSSSGLSVKPPTYNISIDIDVDNKFDGDYSHHVQNLHCILRERVRELDMKVYDRISSAQTLYDFIKKYSTACEIIRKEFKKMEDEIERERNEEDFVTEDDDYFSDDEL